MKVSVMKKILQFLDSNNCKDFRVYRMGLPLYDPNPILYRITSEYPSGTTVNMEVMSDDTVNLKVTSTSEKL
jgi:hypothetical protein